MDTDEYYSRTCHKQMPLEPENFAGIEQSPVTVQKGLIEWKT